MHAIVLFTTGSGRARCVLCGGWNVASWEVKKPPAVLFEPTRHRYVVPGVRPIMVAESVFAGVCWTVSACRHVLTR